MSTKSTPISHIFESICIREARCTFLILSLFSIFFIFSPFKWNFLVCIYRVPGFYPTITIQGSCSHFYTTTTEGTMVPSPVNFIVPACKSFVFWTCRCMSTHKRTGFTNQPSLYDFLLLILREGVHLYLHIFYNAI